MCSVEDGDEDLNCCRFSIRIFWGSLNIFSGRFSWGEIVMMSECPHAKLVLNEVLSDGVT